jgi:hypothetical protein
MEALMMKMGRIQTNTIRHFYLHDLTLTKRKSMTFLWEINDIEKKKRQKRSRYPEKKRDDKATHERQDKPQKTFDCNRETKMKQEFRRFWGKRNF